MTEITVPLPITSRLSYSSHICNIFLWHNSPPVGQGLLIVEASGLHSGTPQSVGLLWTSDQPDGETSTWQKYITHKKKTSMPKAGFEPAIQRREQPQNHAFDRAATGIGYL